MKTYRAAYWISEDRQAEVVLTREDQSAYSDEDLLAAAKEEAEKAGVDLSEGEIEIGEWKD